MEDDYEEEEYEEPEPSRAPAARTKKVVAPKPAKPKPARGSKSGSSGGGIQAATEAAAAATQPPPAKNKRMRESSYAATDDEEVEGARVPAATTSGRAPAAAEDDSLEPRSLYECIELASEGSEHASAILNISVDGWIEVYTSDKRAGIVEWFDMAVQAAGTELTKAFKHGLWKLMETLLDKVKHEILFDEVLMPRLLEWFEICRKEVHASAQHGAQHDTRPLCACAPLRLPQLREHAHARSTTRACNTSPSNLRWPPLSGSRTSRKSLGVHARMRSASAAASGTRMPWARCVPNTALPGYMQSAHHGACECLPSAHHGACPTPPQSLSLSANAEQLAAHEEAVRDMLSTIFDQV